MKNILLKILIIALSISAVFGIAMIIFDFDSYISEKILLTSLDIFCFSILGLCCSTVFEKKYRKPLSILGMATCLLGCIYFLLIIWEIADFYFLHNFDWELMFILPIMSLSFAHLSLVSLIAAKTKHIRLMQIATLIFSVIIDIMIILSIFDADLSWEIFGTLAILITLGTIATPIVNKIAKAPKEAFEDDYTANDITEYINNDIFTEQAREDTVSVFVLAYELYTIAISLKKINEESLNSNTNHTQLLKHLNKMQAMICKMNYEMLQTQTHSLEYFELIVYMNRILCQCTNLLLSQEGNYKEAVCSYIHGFHNLPRAFLPLDNPMKISAKEAMEYFKSYCKA